MSALCVRAVCATRDWYKKCGNRGAASFILFQARPRICPVQFSNALLVVTEYRPPSGRPRRQTVLSSTGALPLLGYGFPGALMQIQPRFLLCNSFFIVRRHCQKYRVLFRGKVAPKTKLINKWMSTVFFSHWTFCFRWVFFCVVNRLSCEAPMQHIISLWVPCVFRLYLFLKRPVAIEDDLYFDTKTTSFFWNAVCVSFLHDAWFCVFLLLVRCCCFCLFAAVVAAFAAFAALLLLLLLCRYRAAAFAPLLLFFAAYFYFCFCFFAVVFAAFAAVILLFLPCCCFSCLAAAFASLLLFLLHALLCCCFSLPCCFCFFADAFAATFAALLLLLLLAAAFGAFSAVLLFLCCCCFCCR